MLTKTWQCATGFHAKMAAASAWNISRVLTRYRLAKLRWLDRPTGQVVRRMEAAYPGDLVHVDVKKLGKIPARRRLADAGPRRR